LRRGLIQARGAKSRRRAQLAQLDIGFKRRGFDRFFAKPIMWAVAQTLPDFRSFSTVRYAADGYNVPWDRVFQDVTVCLAYVIGLSILGYFLLRTREVAK